LKYLFAGLLVFFSLVVIHTSTAEAATIWVSAGGDLQGAINQAQPGDQVVIQAGATFVGPFNLPRKPAVAGKEVVIRTSTPDDQLPAGVRVGPPDAPKMPKLIASNTGWVLNTDQGAAHYRLIGLELAPAAGYAMNNVVLLGGWTSVGNWIETDVSQLPSSIVFDRMYIHGDPAVGSRRGITLNGSAIEVYNSYFSDFKQTDCDAQALLGWNGPGPFIIDNNYLEASGENVMFGGSDPAIAGLIPSNIQIRNNTFSKPLRWKADDPSYEGTHWIVNNLFELKNARNVLFENNYLEHSWAADQNGFAIVITPRNSDGGSPWATVENVTIRNNVIAHSLSGLNIMGWDNNHPSQQTKNVLIQGNLFFDIGGAQWGENLPSTFGFGRGGWFLQLLDGVANVVVEHNTVLESKGVLTAASATPLGDHAGALHTGFVFRDNLVRNGVMGIQGAFVNPGAATLAQYFDSPVIENNVIIGGDPKIYPPNNFFAPTMDDVGFVAWTNGNFQLNSTSPYASKATDGLSMGLTAAPVSSPMPQPAQSIKPVVPGGTTFGSSWQAFQVGSAELTSPGDAPSGLAIFGYRQNGVLVTETGIPASTPLLKGRIYAESAGAVNTGLAISNPNADAVTVSFYFTDANGQDSGVGSFTLPPHGQMARFLDEAPFNVVRPARGTLSFNATLPVAAVAVRGFTNERSEFLLTSLPVADLLVAAPNESFFPHVADGGGWTTDFLLVNPSDNAISGTLELFGVNGQSSRAIAYSIPSRSSRKFSTAGSSSQLQVSSAKVTPSPLTLPPVGAEVLSFKEAGITVSQAGVGSLAAGKGFRMYAEISSSGAIQTGVAITNPSGREARIDFGLTGLDGTSTGLTGSIVVPGLGQRALFLNQIPGFEALAEFKGILRISSAAPDGFAVIGLRSRSNERNEFLVTTTPAVDESTPLHGTVVFPHIVDGDGYTTQFITFSGTNSEPASGALNFYSQSGSSLNLTLR
jgi:hypothetical protein